MTRPAPVATNSRRLIFGVMATPPSRSAACEPASPSPRRSRCTPPARSAAWPAPPARGGAARAPPPRRRRRPPPRLAGGEIGRPKMPRRLAEQVPPVLIWILLRGVRQLVDEALHGEGVVRVVHGPPEPDRDPR